MALIVDFSWIHPLKSKPARSAEQACGQVRVTTENEN
jgi:hypothetical protein